MTTVDRAAAILGDRARVGVPLGPLTTYRVGGPAALFVTAARVDDLLVAADAVSATGIDVVVVGKGSNLLVADAGFDGLAIVLGDAFAGVEIDPTGAVVRAGGAAATPVVSRRTAAAGLTGFEWAVGVPGSIGGAVRMNAGGHGSDMARVLRGVRVVRLDGGEDGWVPVADLDLAYRHSAIGPSDVVVHAEIALAVAADRAAPERAIADIVKWRRDNQPGGQNAGSVFTNPPADSAGRLIDAAGLKGHARGTARVSAKHANFFIADEGGRADDVYGLMVEVQRRVAEATGTVLVPETRLVGFPPFPGADP